jgi:hypothetical protein
MCTIVAATQNNKHFLFKNRDKKNYGTLKIKHEIVKNVEIAYLTDQTGWVEGMNEFGIGFIFAYLEKKDFSNEMYKMDWTVTETPKTHINKNYKSKIEDFKKILTSKTLEEAKNVIISNKWNGNYFVSDSEKTYEIECFLGEIKYQEVTFDKFIKYKVKTNHGILIPNAGHKKNSQSVARASTEIRKLQAEQQLMGFKNFSDLIQRMGQQTYDQRSSLNMFRTDDYERTVSQMLLNLDQKILNVIIYEENSDFFGIEKQIPENRNPKIKIIIRKKEEFEKDEFLNFKMKEEDLFFQWKNLKHSKGENF